MLNSQLGDVRNLGLTNASLVALQRGRREFPDSASIRLFLAVSARPTPNRARAELTKPKCNSSLGEL